MLVLKTKTLGDLFLKFRHIHPSVYASTNNRLSKSTVKVTQGRTLTTLALPNLGVSGVGESVCHPDDAFEKESGRLISLNRACEDAFLNDAQRREVLAAYFGR